MSELLELAERCEKATGPMFALEAAISRALDYPSWPPPLYTTSIDAALTLVPEGAGLSMSRYWIASMEEAVWSAEISTGGIPGNPHRAFVCYDALTPALALCAAALKARHHTGAEDGR